MPVSIHATLAGGDGLMCSLTFPDRSFLSTPPSRVATLGGGNQSEMFSCFYPRHPRGWRRRPPDPADCRDGCFYPRHPRGWRQTGFFRGLGEFVFLSTPPSRVATFGGQLVGHGQDVSIHATLAGGDSLSSPPGWRHISFLSTPPSRVATRSLPLRNLKNKAFLSTPPSRVATSSWVSTVDTMPCFYPRHPRGWRPLPWANLPQYIQTFLSTPPSRVATGGGFLYPYILPQVSIHATLAGGDQGECRRSGGGCVSIHATLAGGDRGF